MRARACHALLALAVALGACSGDPNENGPDGGADEPILGAPCQPPPAYLEDVSGCSPAADDYQPRTGVDTWPPCISDDDAYHPLGASISTIARVEAFETLATLLWRDAPRPTGQAFLAARILFEEEQGLGSRVARRYDPHYPAPATGSCEDAGVPAAHPAYCVGPATIQPILNEAFAQGIQGRARVVNAARIHAALEWFLYVSVVKEATSCAATPADCDSHWAYYAGGGARDDPLGLGAQIRALAPETHQRIYDGLLAVRCWRNLDHEDGVAEDLALRDRAIAQLDRALLRGMALLVRQRFAELGCAEGHYREAALEGLRILVPLLDRAARARDPAAADFLRAEVQKAAETMDAAGAISRLDALFPCY